MYLEVYYNSTSASNRVYVSYKPANRSIGKWTLYTTYTGGAIPTGHTAIAQLYTTSGLSTTANLRVQGLAVILGNTNHNDRLDIQSDGKIVPHSTATRRSGVYGVYDSTKIGHIWSMGSAYQIAMMVRPSVVSMVSLTSIPIIQQVEQWLTDTKQFGVKMVYRKLL